MPKRVIAVTLTIPEAKALLLALGNTTEYPDVLENVLTDGRERAACERAETKISEAYQAARY